MNVQALRKRLQSLRVTQFQLWLAAGAGVLVGLLLVAAVWSWSTWRSISVVPTKPTLVAGQPVATPEPPPPYDTFLILGYGGGTHAGGRLTDTIMSVFVDHKRERITLLSLPRDLWVQLPVTAEGTSGWKLNAAYAIGSDDRRYTNKPSEYTGAAGGGQLAKYAVQQVLGIKMQHFVALDFAGFEQSIDVLGGVDVNVGQAFEDPWYPITGEEENTCGKSEEEIAVITATATTELAQQQFPCRYETLQFERGVQHLDGPTALKYVRSRHSSVAGNDFGRAQRQRELIVAVRDRVLSIGFLPRAVPFINTMAGHVQTDLQLEDMQRLVGEVPGWSEYDVVSLALTDKNVLEQGRSSDRQYVLMPRAGETNFDEVHAWVEAQLATDSANVE